MPWTLHTDTGVHEYELEEGETFGSLPAFLPCEIDGQKRTQYAQCGHCLRIWDDGVSSSLTPTPSARCPFEYDHSHSWGDVADGTLPELVEFDEEMDRLRAAGEFDEESERLTPAEAWEILSAYTVEMWADRSEMSSVYANRKVCEKARDLIGKVG